MGLKSYTDKDGNEFKWRAVGDTVTLGTRTYVVRADKVDIDGCRVCAHFDTCIAISDVLGACAGESRGDGQNIHFEEVTK